MATPGQAFRRNSSGLRPNVCQGNRFSINDRPSTRPTCTRKSGKRNVALFGVQLAQLLTVLLAAACVLLCLLALVAHFRHQAPRQVLQPVHARSRVRRAVGRSLPPDPTPLPSRDPPRFPSHRA
jgi:hypothetical protein